MSKPITVNRPDNNARVISNSNRYNTQEIGTNNDAHHIVTKNTDEALAKLAALKSRVSAMEHFAESHPKEEASAFFLESIDGINGLIQELEALVDVPASRNSAHGPSGAKPSAPADLPPMPTHEELAERGDLYRTPGMATKSKTIIEHLNRVWGPWIKGGVLTRPELLRRDISAYRSLAKWLMKPENNLVEALGADIPTLRTLTDRLADEYAPGERPARVEWALRAREKRATKENGGKTP